MTAPPQGLAERRSGHDVRLAGSNLRAGEAPAGGPMP